MLNFQLFEASDPVVSPRRNLGINDVKNAARARGRLGGRPFALNKDQRNEVTRLRNEGRSLSELSRLFGVSRSTIARTCEIS